MRSSISRTRAALRALLAVALTASASLAQDSTRPPTPGRIRGRVVEDSTGKPIAGAEVLLPKFSRSVRTDSAGRYEFPGLAPESTTVLVRALGYLPDSTVVAVRNRLVVSLELRLAYETITVRRAGGATVAPQALPKVVTEATAPNKSGFMEEFYLRKESGIGKFIDREMLLKWENRRFSELFATVGSVQVKNGGMRGWLVNGRMNDVSCAFCTNPKGVFSIVSEADFAMGARPACYMDIWLDNHKMYEFGRDPPMPLFDVNGIEPASIEGIEVYVGSAQVPSKYNTALNGGCGVVLIWTRNPPPKRP